MKTTLCLMLILFLIMTISQTPLKAGEWGPWETPFQPAKSNQTSPLAASIKLFQKYISPVDGSRCSMYPTCSSYALQAVEQHGPLLGTFIFVDRLYHEGDPHEHQQPIIKHGYIRYYDPLENNTFWLSESL